MGNDYEDLKAERVLAYYGRAEPRDAVDLYFILRQEGLDILIALAAEKDPGFDLYWLAVALNEAERFPDEIERWPVRMLEDVNSVNLKRGFREMAIGIMEQVQTKG